MNKLLLIFIGFMGLSQICGAQTATELVNMGNQSQKEMKESEALQYYKKALEKEPNNLAALCGASFMSSRVGNREKNTTTKKNYFNQAKEYAKKAVTAGPENSTANYVMSVAMGRMALISGSKDKVAASRDIKKYADKAVKINPKNAKAWSVLGVWNMAVSNLNFAEKAAANMLFGGLPDGDIKTAITCFEKCKSLDPNYLVNYLELAKAYKQVNETAKAKSILQAGLAIPNSAQDDANTKAEMKAFLSKL